MKGRETDYKGWALLLIIVCVPAYIIYTSTQEAYPGLIDIVGGVLAITVGTALWMHWNSDEPDNEVRRAGNIVMALLALFGGFNVWAHVTLGRDISAAQEAKKEVRDQKEWEQKLADKEADRNLKLAQAQAQLMEAQRNLNLAEARKLNALPPSQRRSGSGNQSAGVNLLPAAPPTPEVSLTESPSVAAAPLSAADVRNERRGMIVILLMLEMLTAIVGGAWVQAKKSWDGDGDGVPDFVQRIFLYDPDYVAERWPQYLPRLGQRGGQPPAEQRPAFGFGQTGSAPGQSAPQRRFFRRPVGK